MPAAAFSAGRPFAWPCFGRLDGGHRLLQRESSLRVAPIERLAQEGKLFVYPLKWGGQVSTIIFSRWGGEPPLETGALRKAFRRAQADLDNVDVFLGAQARQRSCFRPDPEF
jgi:hypothetical protein